MKEKWFRFIEIKERESQYYQVKALGISGDISNIKDGPKKHSEAMESYYSSLFPWVPDLAEERELKNAAVIKQMESELDYLSKNHEFTLTQDGDNLVMPMPDYFLDA